MTWLDWVLVVPVLPILVGGWVVRWEAWFFDGRLPRWLAIFLAWDLAALSFSMRWHWWVRVWLIVFAVVVTVFAPPRNG